MLAPPSTFPHPPILTFEHDDKNGKPPDNRHLDVDDDSSSQNDTHLMDGDDTTQRTTNRTVINLIDKDPPHAPPPLDHQAPPRVHQSALAVVVAERSQQPGALLSLDLQ